MFFMLSFWILVILCLSFLLKGFIPTISTGKNASHSNYAALDILRERYAKEEIDQAEFNVRKRILRDNPICGHFKLKRRCK